MQGCLAFLCVVRSRCDQLLVFYVTVDFTLFIPINN